jgi:hypothetical protein
VFSAGRAAGVEWYVYEQDSSERDPLESARMSYEFLKSNL